jgi:hypothetical protein
MKEFLEGLKTFDSGMPDLSEFIDVPHNRLGVKHTDETKELCRQAALRQIHSEETRKKMSKSHTGSSKNWETRKKISSTLCKNTYLLKHISGKEVLVNNFTQFCRENNLHHSRMMDRITGKVKKLYKGWTGQVMKSVLG